ncbi:MAG: F0F1 ATP synthase subunit gamma [Gammaproteobacteria bacterium]
MSTIKQIRDKTKTVRSIRKITNAMQMIAASKMRKSQQRMQASRPYAQRVKSILHHLVASSQDCRHPFLLNRPVKKIGLIIVSTDRGLCGGLNINLFKEIVQFMKKSNAEGIEIESCLIGRKAEFFFKKYGGKVLASTANIGEKPSLDKLIGVVQVMLQAFREGNLDRIYLFYNEFKNSMIQKPVLEQLLPARELEEAADSGLQQHHHDPLFEPNPQLILDNLMIRYIESLVYRAVVENVACEQAARMVAMKSATDNAGNLIEELSLKYNKARQAVITQEIAEIVAGAAAV